MVCETEGIKIRYTRSQPLRDNVETGGRGYGDVVVRYICGGQQHPNHDTICTFRKQNRTEQTCFAKQN